MGRTKWVLKIQAGLETKCQILETTSGGSPKGESSLTHDKNDSQPVAVRANLHHEGMAEVFMVKDI